MIYGSGLRSGFANTDHVPGYTQFNVGASHEFTFTNARPLTLAVHCRKSVRHDLRDQRWIWHRRLRSRNLDRGEATSCSWRGTFEPRTMALSMGTFVRKIAMALTVLVVNTADAAIAKFKLMHPWGSGH